MRREGTRTDANHVLVARPGARAVDADVPRTPNVLGIAFDADAEQWLGNWQTGPDQIAVVSAGERSRSVARSAHDATPGNPDVVAAATGAVETVGDAGDVAQVGTLANDYLTSWEDEGATTVYVEDLSGLLEHVPAKTAFRFLHAMLSRAETTDGRLVAAIDSTEQPKHVIQTYAELFDDVQA